MDTRISEKELRAFMERAYEKEGFEQEEARRIADVLMQADLFGIESHGAQRMMYYHQNIKSGSVDVRARAEIVRETPVSALLDGHFAMGHLTAAKAMNIAIEKAKKTGIGMVVVRNSSHYGIAGYYPLMAEREGLAAFSMTNTGPIMVPTFGCEMMLGTNPMAFCMPADPYPFWFDASTTVVTLGKGGCAYWHDGSIRYVSAIDEFRAVDTTGAGDNFLTGIIYGLLTEEPLDRCVRLGNIFAGKSTTAVGCFGAAVTPALIRKYL